MNGHDPFEDRLRDSLRDGAQNGAPDADAFLAEVHRGARSRQRRQLVGVATAAVLLVAGGGVAVGSLGLLSDDEPTIADQPNLTTADTSDEAPTSTLTGSPAGVTINFTADNTDILSVTSTDDSHQWALAQTEAAHCTNICFSVVTRSPATGDWGSPMLVAHRTDGDPTTGVSQVRYVADPAGGYDGWVFGPSLVSIHGVDGGPEPAIWQQVDVGGKVTSLEAHGGTVYALVESGGHSTLKMSRTDEDAFEAVDGTGEFGHASSLVSTAGVVAFLDDSGDTTEVLSSDANPTTGVVTGAWARSQPCAPGSQPISLSSASDTLWVLCSDGTYDTVAFGSAGGDHWNPVNAYRTGLGSMLTARSTGTAVLYPADNTALVLVTADGAGPLTDGSPGFSDPTMLGFTNSDLGFAIADGVLWRTTDGGKTWAEEPVIAQ